MADNRKYYYLKLKDNFFDTDDLVVLESMPDGHMYSNILLKLYLRSLKNEGRLMFKDRIPYNSTILSQITRHTVGVVEKAIRIFEQLGLIEILDNGAIYMLDIQNFIGEGSTEADRKRRYRMKIQNEKENKLMSGQIVGQMSGQMSDERPPEIELEKEIEIELDLDLEEKDEDKKIYEDIIDYLNNKTNKNYKASSKATKRLIKSRLNEGFAFEDFIQVIDIKARSWLKDPKMNTYLRPETLFGTKFEGYLNEKTQVNTNNNDYGW